MLSSSGIVRFSKGLRLVLCQTCLTFYQLENKVRAGVVGGMGDILAALGGVGKVISV